MFVYIRACNHFFQWDMIFEFITDLFGRCFLLGWLYLPPRDTVGIFFGITERANDDKRKKKNDYFNDCYDDLIKSFFEEIGNANMIMVLIMMMIMPVMPALNVIGKKMFMHACALLAYRSAWCRRRVGKAEQQNSKKKLRNKRKIGICYHPPDARVAGFWSKQRR